MKKVLISLGLLTLAGAATATPSNPMPWIFNQPSNGEIVLVDDDIIVDGNGDQNQNNSSTDNGASDNNSTDQSNGNSDNSSTDEGNGNSDSNSNQDTSPNTDTDDGDDVDYD